MKRYLKNLWQALCGHNPYQTERDEMLARLAMADADMEALRKQYCAALEMMEKKDKQITSYQYLTENLRERLADKDTLIERIKKDYQQRIEQYNCEIDRLQSELSAVKNP